MSEPGLPPYETTGGAVHKALMQLGRRWYAEHGARA
jgi:hypothetical protein